MTQPRDAADLFERFLSDSLTTDRAIWAFVRTVPPEQWDAFWMLASDRLEIEEAAEMGGRDQGPGEDQHSQSVMGPNPFARDDLRTLRARLLQEERQRRGRP